MRYYCYICGKSVTSELNSGSIIRAVLICPECIEADKVTFRKEEQDAEEGKGTAVIKCKGCGKPVKWTEDYGNWCASCKPRD